MFEARPTFAGATPYDSANLDISQYLKAADADSTYAKKSQIPGLLNYDVHFPFAGPLLTYQPSQVMCSVATPRALTFPADFAGSVATCVTCSALPIILQIIYQDPVKGATPFGAIVFQPGSYYGTFQTPDRTVCSFEAGGSLRILANVQADQYFAGFSATLCGTIQNTA